MKVSGSLYFENTRKNLKSNLVLAVVLVLELNLNVSNERGCTLRYGQTHKFHYNTENIPRRLLVSAMKLIMVFSLVQCTSTWTRKR